MAVFTEAYTNALLNRDPIQEAVDKCSRLLNEAFEELDYELNTLNEAEGEDEEGKKETLITRIKTLITRFINWLDIQAEKVKKWIRDRKDAIANKVSKSKDDDDKEDDSKPPRRLREDETQILGTIDANKAYANSTMNDINSNSSFDNIRDKLNDISRELKKRRNKVDEIISVNFVEVPDAAN